MVHRDPHSWNDSSQPDTTSIDLRLKIDFAARRLDGSATLSLSRPQPGPLDLDTRDLEIRDVSDADGGPLPFHLDTPDPIVGARLRVQLGATTTRVRVDYATGSSASALQWLTPSMTAGGKQPYLFSQCQTIHARSIVPVQDTPRVRITYTAELTVPRALRGLMAAEFVGRDEKGEIAVEKWRMPQPIPPYLIAFAVGELDWRDVGPRSRVWAEPSVVEAAAREFGEVDSMIGAAEELFGPYDWDRFDLLCMPPSFPYGGMENPRLAFLTPTLLAGDRSLTAAVAHELAHAWTGNLVSNASAEHFWLNEGFTVYAERRIVEALHGAEMAALQAALGRHDLDEALARFADQPELQRLHTRLKGIDPDEALSDVPYEKGFLFLRTIEEQVGREAFDRFLRAYLQEHRFRSITSDDFVRTLERELPGTFDKVDGHAWLEAGGVPANAPEPQSTRLDAVRALGSRAPDDELARRFSPTEWELYLDGIPRPADPALLGDLDRRFNLTRSTNYEVLVAWLRLGVESGYRSVLPRTTEVLGRVGRLKYLKSLYAALDKRLETKDLARRIFERHRAGYHPIAQQVIAKLLAETALAA
jgi:aminopeptidase N